MDEQNPPEETTEGTPEAPQAPEEQAAAEQAAPQEPAESTPEPVAEEAAPEPQAEAAEAEPVAEAEDEDVEYEEPKPREKPAIPGADLEIDIVPEGSDPLAREQAEESYEVEAEPAETVEEPVEVQPQAVVDLAAGARYTATGKRKTAIARVILKPGTGVYTINGKTLDEYFPRPALQRNIRGPLETVQLEGKMDVVATMQGGGVSAQAGALRHGVSRALIVADPNLRSELKRRGFLTRDSRAKERKKAGLKKARKRPQFSKR